MQCDLRPAIWNPDLEHRLSSHLHLLAVFLSKLYSETKLILRHILRLRKRKSSERHLDYCVRSHIRQHELSLLTVSERVGLLLQHYLWEYYIGHHYLLPNFRTSGDICWKPCLHKHMYKQYLLLERLDKSVQQYLRFALWEANDLDRNIRRISVFFMRVLRPEVQLLLCDELHVPQHDLSIWLGNHDL